MLGLAAILALFALAVAQHHHHGGFFPGGQYEHPEHGGVGFIYDPTTHYLVASTHSTCYFMPLDATQQTASHTSSGMEKLELQMMAMMSGGEEELTNAQVEKHSHLIDMECHGDKLYMVGPQPGAPSVSSPEQ
ncbi:uncharacterized protein LOC117314793 [Pecten maximus]|uniref:uncharacterized protein LOC117314793 n=1 Tax=Pecten maximus TaxID=6579 RepID=UPI001458F167|nr:uncharacterized protein LOC117314793 [Pecten maximus]